jgi:hypothetical protein
VAHWSWQNIHVAGIDALAFPPVAPEFSAPGAQVLGDCFFDGVYACTLEAYYAKEPSGQIATYVALRLQRPPAMPEEGTRVRWRNVVQEQSDTMPWPPNVSPAPETMIGCRIQADLRLNNQNQGTAHVGVAVPEGWQPGSRLPMQWSDFTGPFQLPID